MIRIAQILDTFLARTGRHANPVKVTAHQLVQLRRASLLVETADGRIYYDGQELAEYSAEALDELHPPARARSSDPDTARAAAVTVDTVPTAIHVLRALVALGRPTAFQVAEALGKPIQNVSPRFAPLADKGFVRCVGKQHTIGGHARQVWEITGKGRELLEGRGQP